MKIIPSLPALATGLALVTALLGFAPGASAADDLAVAGNTIIRAYSLYCEPTYYDTHKLGDGSWNSDLVESYGRMLLTRYNASCDKFWAQSVAPAEASYNLSQTVPELQREGGGILTDRQAQALGEQLWIDAFYDRYGCSYQQGAGQRVAYDRVLAPYWQKVGVNDAQNIGTGYAVLEVLRTVMGIDPNESAEKLCSLGMLLFAPFTGDVFGGQLATQSEIEAAMPAPGDSNQPEPTRENPPSFTSTPQSSQETWQWIDQAGRENQRQTLIEQLGLREGDPVRAMTMLTGWWWYEEYGNGCDDTDNQYRLALGSWHRTDNGEIVFGKGPFAVGMYEGGCTLSDLRVESDAIVFHGECEQEQEPYSGEGRISITGLKMINLQLPGVNGEGFVLRACPTSEHVDIMSSPQFPTSEEVSADDERENSAVNASQLQEEESFDGAGYLANLNRPLGAIDLHDICRLEDYDAFYAIGRAAAGLPVKISVEAESYSPSESLLRGRSYLQAGAYVGSIYIAADMSAAKLPDGLKKGELLSISGTMMPDNLFITNATGDVCFVRVKADTVERDGF